MQKFLACIVVLYLSFHLTGLALAQKSRKQRNYREFELGNEVAVFFLGEVKDAVVTAVDKTQVQVEFKFGESVQRQIYPYDQVRFRWEKETISNIRKWTSESGHEVIASLLEVDGQKVTLRKMEGGDVKVPITSLSKRDQSFLTDFRKTAGPQLAKGLPPEQFSSSFYFGESARIVPSTLASLPPDIAKAEQTLAMAGASFAAPNMTEMSCIAPVGGGQSWLAAGTVSNFNSPSQMVWASLAKNDAKVQLLPAGEALLAVDAASRQILTSKVGDVLQHGMDQEQVTLTVWQSDPTRDVAKAKICWYSNPIELDEEIRRRSGNERTLGEANFVNWGRFVDSKTIVHQTQTKEFVVWDFVAKKELYRLQQESFFGRRPQLSPNRKYLVFPEDGQVRIIEPLTGKTLASLSGGEREKIIGAGIDPSGRRLAVLTHTRLRIWEFGSASEPMAYALESNRVGFAETVEWVNDSLIVFGGKTLFDLESGQPVWKYVAEPFEVKDGNNFTQLQSIYGGKLVYAVEKDGFDTSMIIVGAVDLPGPKVLETVRSTDRDDHYLVRSGSSVRIQTDCGNYDSKVARALNEIVRRNGWRIDPTSNIVLKAWMGKLPVSTQTYITQGRQGSTKQETVTIEPYGSELTVLVGNEEVWKSGTRSSPPSSVLLLPWQTIESRVQSMQTPKPEFFAQIDVPERIIDPKFRDGFGVSILSSSGLTPFPLNAMANLPAWAKLP